MKIDFIADTNFLVYIHEGNPNVEPFLNYNFGISFISEVELLGFKGIKKTEEIKLKELISDILLRKEILCKDPRPQPPAPQRVPMKSSANVSRLYGK